jgi:hypothetical protein
MTRKWGSCSTPGRMTVNSKLLNQPAEFRKKVMKLFRALVRVYLGNENVG